MDQLVRAFFERYERANSSSDLSAIASLYADTFLFGGPNGVQAVKKQDFLKVVPRMKAHFASLGLSATELQSLEASALDSRYLLAEVGWRMILQNISGRSMHFDASATYILERTGADSISIVFQIDHQDLATVIRNQQTARTS
jgi:ketosteroid isomerase-like protein